MGPRLVKSSDGEGRRNDGVVAEAAFFRRRGGGRGLRSVGRQKSGDQHAAQEKLHQQRGQEYSEGRHSRRGAARCCSSHRPGEADPPQASLTYS